VNSELQSAIEALQPGAETRDPGTVRALVSQLLDALEQGSVRAAIRGDRGWEAQSWVKQGILWAFRAGIVQELPPAGPLWFRDKDLLPPQTGATLRDVRVVAGGTAVRRGAHLGAGTILMPPCYVNVGAFVGAGSMVDSHALVGSCAQVGERVHLSAGVQIGGVLEPPGALPVVIEDDVFVGALSAVLEGVRVARGAVIGAGVILTRSTPLFDLVHERRLTPGADGVLEVPDCSVVIAGNRPLPSAWAQSAGLTSYAALIVKRRDHSTDARSALEGALR
jgi:2,3,4,5-tetrahydropyridine-2-carboxylate N-succinyltransferase